MMKMSQSLKTQTFQSNRGKGRLAMTLTLIFVMFSCLSCYCDYLLENQVKKLPPDKAETKLQLSPVIEFFLLGLPIQDNEGAVIPNAITDFQISSNNFLRVS